MSAPAAPPMAPARVYLIGAGPGDPELITVKGRRILETAGVVLYDNLAPISLLDLAPQTAERIYVGKKKSDHACTQDEIAAMMIDRARRGLTVVRLKGGDPFIFGRGGEEAEALAEAGVPFEVVPGVTAALGLAAYSGVPLTHRDYASSVAFITGHSLERIDWGSVSRVDTIVVFMGLTTFAEIARELIGHGRSPDTPAMAVRWATRADQQTLVGTMKTLPRIIERNGMKPPATVVIGEVVRLRGSLSWFENLPLSGRRIVVTRAREQAGSLSARFRELGADAIEIPTIEIRPAAGTGPLDAAIARLADYDWLVFTSANGVRYFLERLDRSPLDLRALRARIAAIGPATRAAIEALRLKVDLMGEEFVAESLLDAFVAHDMRDKRVLLPRAAEARDTLPRELRRRGAVVDVVEAYRNVVPADAASRARDVFGSPRKPDFIAFTSASTVRQFIQVAPAGALEGVRVASIGPVTTRAAREAGLEVAAEAREFTTAGLVEAILTLCAAGSSSPDRE